VRKLVHPVHDWSKDRRPLGSDVRGKLLVFLTRRDAEATNDVSERALRPSVIFRKVTNVRAGVPKPTPISPMLGGPPAPASKYLNGM
jgi:hypothetical protein